VADAGAYQPVVNAAASKYGIDPTWLSSLLWQENKFRPTGTSPAGAQGIAQFMPGTAARYGVNVKDPVSSIDGAAHYLSDNLKMFGGNVGLATAAYNWGEGNVQKWMRSGGSVPKETQDYVANITGKPISSWAGAGGASSRSGVTPTPASNLALGTTLTSTPNMGTAPATVTPPDFGKPKPADQQKPTEPDKPPQAPDFQLNPLPLHRPDMVQAAQMQQAMGYQPSPIYGVGLTSTPGQFSSAAGAGQQQGQQPLGQNPMLMQLVQQIAMQQAQGQSPYGSYGGGYGGY
jgi:hypothetical protein